NEKLINNNITATQRFSRPPARYTEATLVKKLEELGIGRPSTYAPTISTIVARNYVEKGTAEGTERNYQVLQLASDKISSATQIETVGAGKAKVIPLDIGNIVSYLLVKNFETIRDYNFTVNV